MVYNIVLSEGSSNMYSLTVSRGLIAIIGAVFVVAMIIIILLIILCVILWKYKQR